MLRYLLGWIAGLVSAILVFSMVILKEHLIADITILICINVACGIWAYRHHQNKRQAYYNRFKARR